MACGRGKGEINRCYFSDWLGSVCRGELDPEAIEVRDRSLRSPRGGTGRLFRGGCPVRPFDEVPDRRGRRVGHAADFDDVETRPPHPTSGPAPQRRGCQPRLAATWRKKAGGLRQGEEIPGKRIDGHGRLFGRSRERGRTAAAVEGFRSWQGNWDLTPRCLSARWGRFPTSCHPPVLGKQTMQKPKWLFLRYSTGFCSRSTASQIFTGGRNA